MGWITWEVIKWTLNAHVISINHLELQMTQLSTVVNPRQPWTLPSNTIQITKKDGHCMTITTWWGRQTIDPPIPSLVEDEIRKDEEVMETGGELVDKTVKEAKGPMNVVPIPRPPPPLPYRLVKKNKDGKYHRLITLLEKHSINIALIEALE